MNVNQRLDLEFSAEQFRDWLALGRAIDEAETEPPCVNFPDAWFPDKDWMDGNRYEVALAKQMCHQCPVIKECLMFALKHHQAGIWGGMAERERDRFIRSGRMY